MGFPRYLGDAGEVLPRRGFPAPVRGELGEPLAGERLGLGVEIEEASFEEAVGASDCVGSRPWRAWKRMTWR